MKNKLFIIGMILDTIFALALHSVQAYSGLSPERRQALISRIETLGLVYDNLETRKNDLRAIIEDIERQQTELYREAEGHRMELTNSQQGL